MRLGYILIYEALQGAKLRGLRKRLRFCESDTIGILVELWLFAKRNAQADGRLVNTDVDDLVFEFESKIRSDVSAEFVVRCLIESGWLDDREDGLYVHDWEYWQNHMYSHQRVKNRDRERKQKERQRNEKQAALTVANEQETEQQQMTLFADDKPETAKIDETGFEEAWKAYPRKKDKGLARKAYIARINDGFAPDELISASRAYARECEEERKDEKYIKRGATFFGPSTPFTDYLKRGSSDDSDDSDIKGCYL